MISSKNPASSVPRSRFERLAHLGGLAGRVAGGMLAEGMRQMAKGNLPSAADLVLTPANARRVAENGWTVPAGRTPACKGRRAHYPRTVSA